MSAYTHEAECIGKVTFLNKAEAKKAKATTTSNRPWLVLHPYRCPTCNGWHLGHAPAAALER